MKIKNIIGILIALIILSAVSAVPVPYIIGGKVTAGGIGYKGIEVTFFNERAVESFRLKTSDDGSYILSDAGKYIDAKDGDWIKVSVKGEVYRFKLTEEPTIVNFELSDVIIIPCDPCICPEDKVCPECKIYPTCPSDGGFNWWILFIVFLIGTGFGTLIYYLIKREG